MTTFIHFLCYTCIVKRTSSILMTVLVLMTGLHLSFDSHFCKGELSAVKFSITGEKASCDMKEESEALLPGVKYFKTHCCVDDLVSLTVDSNYSPSFTNFNTFTQNILQVFMIPASVNFHSLTAINFTSTDASPPGNVLIHAVSLPKICVFLI
jgi:hypothetical protein